MVAYSFQPRFAELILSGAKTQTIRAPRHRETRAGETLQLYVGMRTKECRLLRTATCVSVRPIRIRIDCKWDRQWIQADGKLYTRLAGNIDDFARRDGFKDWDDMREFFRGYRPGQTSFPCVIIRWSPPPPVPEPAPEPYKGRVTTPGYAKRG